MFSFGARKAPNSHTQRGVAIRREGRPIAAAKPLLVKGLRLPATGVCAQTICQLDPCHNQGKAKRRVRGRRQFGQMLVAVPSLG
jgi:hypothetical protein